MALASPSARNVGGTLEPKQSSTESSILFLSSFCKDLFNPCIVILVNKYNRASDESIIHFKDVIVFCKLTLLSLLIGLQQICDSYSLERREYYFDRSPRNFDAILCLYRQTEYQSFFPPFLEHWLWEGGDKRDLWRHFGTSHLYSRIFFSVWGGGGIITINGGCRYFICPGRKLFRGGCIHNEGYLKGVDLACFGPKLH